MEEINARIKEYVAVGKLNGASFARKLKMNPVSVNQWLTGKRKVSWEFVQAILDNDKELSSDWLTRGIGKMYEDKNNSNESNLQITRELADAKVKILIQEGIIDRLSKILENRIDTNNNTFVKEKYEQKLG